MHFRRISLFSQDSETTVYYTRHCQNTVTKTSKAYKKSGIGKYQNPIVRIAVTLFLWFMQPSGIIPKRITCSRFYGNEIKFLYTCMCVLCPNHWSIPRRNINMHLMWKIQIRVSLAFSRNSFPRASHHSPFHVPISCDLIRIIIINFFRVIIIILSIDNYLTSLTCFSSYHG